MTDTVTRAEFGVFKAETRNFQSGLASAVVDPQDAFATMQNGLAEAQTGLAKMQDGLTAAQEAVAQMAEHLNGDGS